MECIHLLSLKIEARRQDREEIHPILSVTMDMEILFPRTAQEPISQKYLTKYNAHQEINLPVNLFQLHLEPNDSTCGI